MKLTKKIDSVRERIKKAAKKSGRDDSDITLVCVVKEASSEDIVTAVENGRLFDIGENRIQDAIARKEAFLGRYDCLRWHFIGHLQSNKAKKAVKLFDLIHSVDSIELAVELNRHAEEAKKIQEFLLQVNVSGEDSKFGISPDRAEEFVKGLGSLDHVILKGLMTMAPYSDNAEDSRKYFRGLRMLRDRLSRYNKENIDIRHLSMGMSGDFEIAVEEGADLLRIGSAIFK
ncbi:MAG: YggS family pyridoxal phosphate-dependent enzyme [Candidatus Omnitrophica bacterium]|nr:YggS family pyridoxal phosphate-dependent enzyme [Candidatus Omnitrophota bacterium]